MALSREQVTWVAHLARLELSEAELETMTAQLGSILDYVEQLKQVDTENVEPLVHPMPLQNVLRDDEPTASLPLDQALSNAPKKSDDCFLVPAVFHHD